MLTHITIAGLLLLCLLRGNLAFALDDIYSDSAGQGYLSLGYGGVQQADLKTGAGEQVVLTTNEVRSSWLVHSERFRSVTLGAEFEYTIMDFVALQPMTNGHLHRWKIPLTWRESGMSSNFSIRLAPAISVSSNVLRNPELADHRSLQLNIAAIYRNNVSGSQSWLAGIGGDHRFGDYRIYPVAGYVWRFAESWEAQLAFPDAHLSKRFENGSMLALFAGPRGNQWHVFSKDKMRESDFEYETVIVGVSTIWVLHQAFSLTLDIERHLKRRFEIVLDDGSMIRPEAGSSSGILLRGKIIF